MTSADGKKEEGKSKGGAGRIGVFSCAEWLCGGVCGLGSRRPPRPVRGVDRP